MKQRRRKRGQVLIYMVMIMLIGLVIAIFLFDLQYFIRLRAKTQNASDSAALTAAGWQGRSLNMIGELNLIKVTDLMINNVPPIGDDTESGLLASDALITNMQTRLTYVGPLMGFLTAQQAAKKNGMWSNSTYNSRISDHVYGFLGWGSVDGSIYDEIYAPYIPYNGYYWLPEYRIMLRRIISERIAALPVNSRYLRGRPKLEGRGASLLMNPGFYAAVNSRNWCWFVRMGIKESDVYDFKDIKLVQSPQPFFPGSEFLNLYVSFEEMSAPNVNTYLNQRNLSKLPSNQPGIDELTWAVYDGNWDSTSKYSFLNNYLRSPFKSEYTYGGAAARFVCESDPSLLSGRWTWSYGEDDSSGRRLGSSLAWSDEKNFGNSQANFASHGSRLNRAESHLSYLRSSSSVSSVAAAKPFGSLENGLAPHEAGIVLPVFTEVRLIPTVLVDANFIDSNYELYKFILAYFGHPDYPDVPDEIKMQFPSFVRAIEQFTDRESGFHSAWANWEEWREDYINGEDDIIGTNPATGIDDDRRDPCDPPPRRPGGGGGGGGGSGGGPGILH